MPSVVLIKFDIMRSCAICALIAFLRWSIEKSLVFGSGALLYALFALNNGVLREDVKSGLYDLL